MGLIKRILFAIAVTGLAVFCIVFIIKNVVLFIDFRAIDTSHQKRNMISLDREITAIKSEFDSIYRKDMDSFKETAGKLEAEKRKSRVLEENLEKMPRIPEKELKK